MADTNDVIPLVSEADPNMTSGVGPATTAVAVPLSATERYTLGDEIARGGMGIIYRATDTRAQRGESPSRTNGVSSFFEKK